MLLLLLSDKTLARIEPPLTPILPSHNYTPLLQWPATMQTCWHSARHRQRLAQLEQPAMAQRLHLLQAAQVSLLGNGTRITPR